MNLLPSHAVTERLVLRQFVEDDWESVQAAIDESRDHLRPWHLGPWTAWIRGEVSGTEAGRDMLRSGRVTWENGGDSILGIFRAGTLVGVIGLHPRVGPGGVEIGYWAHVDHTGQGYITEAAAALTTAAFAVPGIERVEIHHDPANLRSEGVARRLGYTRLGTGPDRARVAWTMSREEWSRRSTR